VALAFRVTVAALIALVVAQFLKLQLPLWAVLTAVIVSQLSVGRSLKTGGDYLLGTLAGAVYGGALAVLLPHESELALLGVLVLATAPLALVAALRPNLAVLPITALIVLLVPAITHAKPLDSAIDRVVEVAVGAVVGIVVSFAFPAHAHRQLLRRSAAVLGLMAQALDDLLDGLTRGHDVETMHRLQDGIGRTLAEVAELAGEAEQERRARVTHTPETGPLTRTLLRLRHDLVIVGRAASQPWTAVFQARLGPLMSDLRSAAGEYLRQSGEALAARRAGGGQAPDLAKVERALAAYGAEVLKMRHEGLTRGLAGDAAEHFFALGFALEQMRQNLRDLARVVDDWRDA
jgi:uncharacterized membrane protein YccC